ncbi:MAG: hypothetical protein H6R01_1507 [Burkholderiaceae bacterium]|nr:hypothetical protein [Burkholderiaceae bacterium]
MRALNTQMLSFQILRRIMENPRITTDEILAEWPTMKPGALKRIFAERDISHNGAMFVLPEYLVKQIENTLRRAGEATKIVGIQVQPSRIDLMHRPPMKCALADVLANQSHRLRVR